MQDKKIRKKSFKAHNPSIVYDKPPDGGYGWFIVGKFHQKFRRNFTLVIFDPGFKSEFENSNFEIFKVGTL